MKLPLTNLIFFLAALGLCHCASGFLQLRRTGATLRCSAWASHCGGFSCCKTRALGTRASVVVAHGLSSCSTLAPERVGFSSCGAWAQQLQLVDSRTWAQQLWRTDLVARHHVGSSWTRDRTRVPCIGRRILNHWTTREVLINLIVKNKLSHP